MTLFGLTSTMVETPLPFKTINWFSIIELGGQTTSTIFLALLVGTRYDKR